MRAFVWRILLSAGFATFVFGWLRTPRSNTTVAALRIPASEAKLGQPPAPLAGAVAPAGVKPTAQRVLRRHPRSMVAGYANVNLNVTKLRGLLARNGVNLNREGAANRESMILHGVYALPPGEAKRILQARNTESLGSIGGKTVIYVTDRSQPAMAQLAKGPLDQVGYDPVTAEFFTVPRPLRSAPAQ